jgi:hypothetical protein
LRCDIVAGAISGSSLIKAAADAADHFVPLFRQRFSWFIGFIEPSSKENRLMTNLRALFQVEKIEPRSRMKMLLTQQIHFEEAIPSKQN